MKKKFKLTDLKVQSFVTALNEEEKLIARGGVLEEIIQGIPQTFSICGISVCQMGTVCTQIAETKLLTCLYCKPKN